MPDSIWHILEARAAATPDALAVVDGERRLTYGEVAGRSRALAAHLRAEGIEPGDRVAVIGANSLAFLELYFAAAGAGAVLVPVNVRLSEREVEGILEDAGARRLLRIPGDHEAMVAAGDAADFQPADVGEQDLAHLYYTSGTTGRPRGVMLTHRNVCLHARRAADELGLGPDDAWGHIAPMFHLADAWATFAVTAVGGRHVMVPRFDATATLAAIERERITISNLIPTMLNAMVKDPGIGRHDLGSLRVILSGGAPIAPDLVRRIIETFGCDYVQTYGMTETSPYLTLSLLPEHLQALPAEERLVYQAKTGRPFLGVDLRVIGADGAPVPADGETVGEIRVRGETVTPGYWNNPEETHKAFDGDWLKTGDLAVLDAEGFVDIVDRKKDMIITGGENVYSIEVENVLYEHPAVLEAAVVGEPDETWGEAVKAFVVVREGRALTAEEATAWCRDRLAGFKVPKRVEFLAELPKTGSGKIQKAALRSDGFTARGIPLPSSGRRPSR